MQTMQTPPKNQPHHPRASSKHHKTQSRPEVQRNVQSDNDVYQTFAQDGEQTPSRKNKKTRKRSNVKKSGAQSDVGEVGEPPVPRPHRTHNQRVRATPVKDLQDQAYAGPTFHQSPAPSALPMPSFYSISVPNNAPISTITETTDGTFDVKTEDKLHLEEARETTPLDFLFNAARQARTTPNGIDPARLYSPQTGSPAQRSPAIRDGDTDFPFEFDSADDTKSKTSTPFSQRLAASKTPKSTSEGGVTLTDEERQAKTAALKKALMPSVSNEAKLGPAFNDNNPFNAKNAPTPPAQRQISNPSTPQSNGYPSGPNTQYFPFGSNSPTRNFTPQTSNRTASSNLRHVYSPPAVPMSPPSTTPGQRVSTARSPPPQRQLNFEAIYGGTPRPQSEGNPVGHNPKPSLEQGLDDLRKALNMNFPNFA